MQATLAAASSGGNANDGGNVKRAIERKHECLECGKHFPTPSKLQRHSFIHTGEKPHNSPHCPKSYSQLVHLQDHLISHEKQGVDSLPETVREGELSEGPAVAVEVDEEAIQIPDQFEGDEENDVADEEVTPLKGTSLSGEANYALLICVEVLPFLTTVE